MENHPSFGTVVKAESFLTEVLLGIPVDLKESAEKLLSMKANEEVVFKVNKYHHDSGKVVLLGDAAHTMSSAFGQVRNTELPCVKQYLI